MNRIKQTLLLRRKKLFQNIKNSGELLLIQEIGRTVGNSGDSRKNRETWAIWYSFVSLFDQLYQEPLDPLEGTFRKNFLLPLKRTFETLQKEPLERIFQTLQKKRFRPFRRNLQKKLFRPFRRNLQKKNFRPFRRNFCHFLEGIFQTFRRNFSETLQKEFLDPLEKPCSFKLFGPSSQENAYVIVSFLLLIVIFVYL